MPKELIHYEGRDDIALVTIDSPPVNSLSRAVVQGISDAIGRAAADAQIKAIVIMGAGGNFVAGADIGELQQAAEDPGNAQLGEKLADNLEQIESNEKPVVMAIDGFALGGGLELAIAGHYRVGTTRCRVGLPELQLGLIPGAAGTQRLPRILCDKLGVMPGLQKAAEMMLQSKEARGTEPLELGVLQEQVPPEQLLETALAAARKLAAGEIEKVRASQLGDRLCSTEEAQGFLQMAIAMMGNKGRNLVHPEYCLDAMLCGASEGYAAGLARERENFAKCLATSQAQGLIHVFFASRAAPKVPGVTDQGFEKKTFRRAAVLGGGTMGSGIATSLLYAGLDVVLKEIDDELVDAGRDRIDANLASRVRKGRLAQAKYDDMMSRLHLQTDYSGFDKVDIVIEAVIEKVDLKQRVFADVVRAIRPDCVLASNTSTIDITVVGAKSGALDRMLGTHFFSPAHIMPLVEIVRTDQTSPETINSVIALARQMKKTPVTVGNCVGFLVNRIFFPYGQVAGLLVDHGLDPYHIDQVIFDFGMPMGPFRMSDLAGVDVAKFAGGILAEAYSDRIYVSSLVDHMFQDERFGQKVGRGYYTYEDPKTAKPDPQLTELLEKARADAGNPAALDIDDNEIVERIFFGVVNEACRCLDENIAIRPSDIDIATVMGMGFPAYRGGIMKWADSLGADYIVEKLERWAEAHGNIFAPGEYLKAKAAKKENLVCS